MSFSFSCRTLPYIGSGAHTADFLSLSGRVSQYRGSWPTDVHYVTMAIFYGHGTFFNQSFRKSGSVKVRTFLLWTRVQCMITFCLISRKINLSILVLRKISPLLTLPPLEFSEVASESTSRTPPVDLSIYLDS